MRTIEYRTVDKSEWPSGPWHEEPDKAQYQCPDTGLPCLIVRNPVGALCGYVGVPKGHPLHGETDPDLRVHGGVTFTGGCHAHPTGEGHGICHVPEPGEPDDVWWIGFDCSHCGDLAPGNSFLREMDGNYRDMGYVRQEIKQLAQQIVGFKKG